MRAPLFGGGREVITWLCPWAAMGAPSTSMSDPPRPKPLPARPPGPGSAERAPPAPVPAHTPPPPPVEAAPEPVAEEAEVVVVGRGGTWIARVLGRSGRAAARSAPLILVGFRPRESASEAPTLECLLPARRLSDLSAEALEAALAAAKAPPPPDERRPFFDEADATRRSGPASEY